MDRFNQYLLSSQGVDRREFLPQSLLHKKITCTCAVCAYRLKHADQSSNDILGCLSSHHDLKFKITPLATNRNSVIRQPTRVSNNESLQLRNSQKKSFRQLQVPLNTNRSQNQVPTNRSQIATSFYQDSKVRRSEMSVGTVLEKSIIIVPPIMSKYMLTEAERLQLGQEFDERRAKLKSLQNNREVARGPESEKQKSIRIFLKTHQQKLLEGIKEIEKTVNENYLSNDQQEKSNRAFEKLNPQAPLPLNRILGSQTERQYTSNFRFLLTNLQTQKQQYLLETKSIKDSYQGPYLSKVKKQLPQKTNEPRKPKDLKYKFKIDDLKFPTQVDSIIGDEYFVLRTQRQKIISTLFTQSSFKDSTTVQ